MKRLAALACGLGLLLGCSQYSTTVPVPPSRVLLVANSAGDSVAVFNVVAGSATLVRTITGSTTGLAFPTGVGFSAGLIFVSNNTVNTITVYPAAANGDTAPMTTISGTNTGLSRPADIDVDSAGRVYVANVAGNSVRIFAANATGNAIPLASIAGPTTALNAPNSIHHDSAGNIYVVNGGNASVTVYRSADVFSSISGDVAPFATISGALTGMTNPTGIELDSGGNIYVTNVGPDAIEVYPPNATGNQAPSSTIAGAATGLNVPADVDIVGNDLIVANAGANDLLAFPIGSSGDVAPAFTITGSGLNAPNSLGTE